jgi:adenine C2-methylase RlmN of 23S rRNA A2503 and tRNA A37
MMTTEYKIYESSNEVSTHASMEEARTALMALKEQYPEKEYGIAIPTTSNT